MKELILYQNLRNKNSLHSSRSILFASLCISIQLPNGRYLNVLWFTGCYYEAQTNTRLPRHSQCFLNPSWKSHQTHVSYTGVDISNCFLFPSISLKSISISFICSVVVVCWGMMFITGFDVYLIHSDSHCDRKHFKHKPLKAIKVKNIGCRKKLSLFLSLFFQNAHPWSAVLELGTA